MVASRLFGVEFIAITIAALLALFGVLYLFGTRYPGSGAEVVDWQPTRSAEMEAQLEQEDVSQMIEARNVYRRHRGEDEVSETDVERQVREDERVRQQASASQDSLREEIIRADRDEIDVESAIRAERDRRQRSSRI